MIHAGVALVTGASVGIGAAFARALAAEGRELVLVARDERRLSELAGELRRTGAVEVEVLAADLTTDEGCDVVRERIARAERPVELLVNNAGMGRYEPLGERDLVEEEQLLDLNVRAVLRLTHAAVPAMKARGHGTIINVSSVASLVPRAIGSTYAASKAWVTHFSECLAQQLHGTGVTVTAVCPGFVHTEFHQRAGIGRAEVPAWMWVDADDVVTAALAAAAAGRPITVPGRRWRTTLGLARLLPRSAVRRALRGRGL